MSDPEFDEFADNYDEVLADSMPPGMAENSYFAEYKIKLISKKICDRKPLRILDFGCGSGRSLPYIYKYFPKSEIWGFDVSPKSLNEARDKIPNVELVSDLSQIGEVKFDLIIAANVFHHIPLDERVEALKKCKTVFSPGGVMYIFEHNPYNPMTKWVFERCSFDVDATMLSRGEMVSLTRKARLKVVSTGYTLFFPAQLAFLRGLEKALQSIPMGAQYFLELKN